MEKNEEELLDALLAAFISADNNTTSSEREKNIGNLQALLNAKDLLNEHQREIAESSVKLLQKEISEDV